MGALALVAVVLMVGFCLFDRDADHAGGHQMSLDLCLGMLATTATVLLVVGLAPGYRLVPAYAGVLYATPLRLLDPPPKSPSRS